MFRLIRALDSWKLPDIAGLKSRTLSRTWLNRRNQETSGWLPFWGSKEVPWTPKFVLFTYFFIGLGFRVGIATYLKLQGFKKADILLGVVTGRQVRQSPGNLARAMHPWGPGSSAFGGNAEVWKP